VIRVGHKGADLVVPGNTRASFEAAAAIGVDTIEFDVLPAPEGGLVIAHDLEDAARRTPLTLDEGLDVLAGPRFHGLGLQADLKWHGYEAEVVEALAARGLLERTLVSSQFVQSLGRVGELSPRLRRGWSMPRVRRDYLRSPLAPIAYGAARVLRARLPARAAAALRAGRCEVIMPHWILVSPALVAAVHAAGGELYVWTVDDRPRMDQLEALGVDGITTNDPRLFHPQDAELAEAP
jgi:glycerophosphoryl diester phosphodiesterase